MALQQLQQMGGALAAYRAVLRVAPRHAAVHANAGTVLRELARSEEAAHAYGSALHACRRPGSCGAEEPACGCRVFVKPLNVSGYQGM